MKSKSVRLLLLAFIVAGIAMAILYRDHLMRSCSPGG